MFENICLTCKYYKDKCSEDGCHGECEKTGEDKGMWESCEEWEQKEDEDRDSQESNE